MIPQTGATVFSRVAKVPLRIIVNKPSGQAESVDEMEREEEYRGLRVPPEIIGLVLQLGHRSSLSFHRRGKTPPKSGKNVTSETIAKGGAEGGYPRASGAQASQWST